MNKPRLLVATSYAAVMTITFVVAITIWAERSTPLKDWLKSVSGHHWTTKSIFSAVLFVVAAAALYPLVKNVSGARVKMALQSLLTSTLAGVVLLIAFFSAHYFKVL